MTTRHYIEPQGLARWANTDPSLHVNVIAREARRPTWQSCYIYCLRHNDYDAAELIRRRNDRAYRNQQAVLKARQVDYWERLPELPE